MSEEEAPAARVVSQLASELAEVVARRYRIDVPTARALIVEAWAADAALLQQAAQGDAAKVARTRAYKQAADRAKTKIYYHLRRYRQDDAGLHDAAERLHGLAAAGVGMHDPRVRAAREAVVASHVSTRERLEDLPAFFTALFALVPEPSSILDLGCGVMPLLYPFDGPFEGQLEGPLAAGRSTTRYVALDRDAVAVELCAAWSGLVGPDRLKARRWALGEGFADIRGPEPDGRFALALALKLVPVIARQERAELSTLAAVPARRLLVTGAKQAMVKRRAIDRREERVLRSFAEQHGFTIAGTLDTPSEIGLLLERA